MLLGFPSAVLGREILSCMFEGGKERKRERGNQFFFRDFFFLLLIKFLFDVFFLSRSSIVRLSVLALSVLSSLSTELLRSSQERERERIRRFFHESRKNIKQVFEFERKGLTRNSRVERAKIISPRELVLFFPAPLPNVLSPSHPPFLIVPQSFRN